MDDFMTHRRRYYGSRICSGMLLPLVQHKRGIYSIRDHSYQVVRIHRDETHIDVIRNNEVLGYIDLISKGEVLFVSYMEAIARAMYRGIGRILYEQIMQYYFEHANYVKIELNAAYGSGGFHYVMGAMPDHERDELAIHKSLIMRKTCASPLRMHLSDSLILLKWLYELSCVNRYLDIDVYQWRYQQVKKQIEEASDEWKDRASEDQL